MDFDFAFASVRAVPDGAVAAQPPAKLGDRQTATRAEASPSVDEWTRYSTTTHAGFVSAGAPLAGIARLCKQNVSQWRQPLNQGHLAGLGAQPR